jgi:hypothetical protein
MGLLEAGDCKGGVPDAEEVFSGLFAQADFVGR